MSSRSSGRATGESADAKALIRLLEETVPVAALRVLHQAETIDDPEPFMTSAGIPDRRRPQVAERIQAACMAQGLTRHEAGTRIRMMPPFDQILVSGMTVTAKCSRHAKWSLPYE